MRFENISEIIIFILFLNLNLEYWTSAQSYPYKARYENLTQIIEFHEDSTFIEKVKPIDILPFCGWLGEDTIAVGKYFYHKNHYFLYTSPKQRYSTLEMVLLKEERTSDSSNLTIILNSPFESQKSKYAEKNRSYEKAYFYMLKFTYQDDDQLSDTLLGPYFANIISVPKNSHKLKSVTVFIYPYERSKRISPYFYCLSAKYLFTNNVSNKYVFNIPDFSTMYIYWKRYNGKIVKIVGKNIITMDGRSFLTQGNEWKLNKNNQFLLKKNSPYKE